MAVRLWTPMDHAVVRLLSVPSIYGAGLAALPLAVATQTERNRTPMNRNLDDPRAAQYEQERADAVQVVAKAIRTMFIGPPPPMLLGIEERAVDALVGIGWAPSTGQSEPDGRALGCE